MAVRTPFLCIIACALLIASDVEARSGGHRRALLIGINDYTASRIGGAPRSQTPDRDWHNLSGTVNDVHAMADLLVLLYRFDRRDIVTLTDQEATRSAMIAAIENHLVGGASKDDVLFFYYAGHGSQVRNSLSDERDKLDESIVPADSRLGADDIRDKELRGYFNRILDQGARLTVMLDNCHSGSGARGLGTGAHPRGIRPDLRDVADRTSAGPRPEERGALVLSAAQDFDEAWETRDAGGTFHGAFTWAWMRSIRDSSAGEPAMETFLRAQARLRGETPFQEPVIAGNAEARLAPFLGGRSDRREDRPVIAIEKVQSNGTIVLAGGWANGLAVGSVLQPANDPHSAVRLKITAMRGLGESEAHPESGASLPRSMHSGMLLEVVGWTAPPARPLRVWMPRAAGGMEEIASTARTLAAEAARRGVRWVRDPIDATPALILRWRPSGWEMVAAGGDVEHIGSDSAAVAAVARMTAGTSLFVQFPAPAALTAHFGGTGVESTDRPDEADYVLVGRYSSRHLAYAWLRPLVRRSDRRKSGLPLRTAWIAVHKQDNASGTELPRLREALLRLRRIHAWNTLESPPSARFPYQLALRRERDGELARDSAVLGNDRYELVLRVLSTPVPPRVAPRYIYAFTIDSHGKSTLLFPPGATGSVENRFPPSPPPSEIALGDSSSFEIAPPYGIDTYILLTTDEPLPNPWILEWDGVRAAPPNASPLEQLLMMTAAGTRTAPFLTPSNWSIERVVYESLPRRARR